MTTVPRRRAFRRMLHSGGVHITTVIVLAVVMTFNTALFSIAYSLLLAPLPYPDSALLGVVGLIPRTSAVDNVLDPLSPNSYRLIADSPELQTKALVMPRAVADSGPSESLQENIVASSVSADFFDTLGVRPLFGRTLGVDGGDAVVGYRAWRSIFSSAPVGSVITLTGREYRLAGVMPQGFDFPVGTNVWITLDSSTLAMYSTFNAFLCVARFQTPGAISRVSKVHPGFVATPLASYLHPHDVSAVTVLFVGSVLLLLIAWIHVGALQLSRLAGRRTELGVLCALGAPRSELFLEGLWEGVFVTVFSLAIVALGLTPTLALLRETLPTELTAGSSIQIDYVSLSYALLASVAGLSAFVLAPMVMLWRFSPASALRAESATLGPPRVRLALAGFQIAMSTALLYAAGVNVLSATTLVHADLGFTPQNLFAIVWATDGTAKVTADTRHAEAVAEQLRQSTWVTSASVSSARPLGGTAVTTQVRLRQDADGIPALWQFVGADYFKTLQTRMLAGRPFDGLDRRGATLRAVINKRLAADLGYDVDRAVGQPVLVSGIPHVIQGVADDVRVRRPDERPTNQIYSAASQWGVAPVVVFRSALPPGLARPQAQDVVKRLHADERVRMMSIAAEAERVVAIYRARAVVLSAVGLCALALTIIGLYGTLSYLVVASAKDTAIRLALGASTSAIVADLFRPLAVLWSGGLVAGLALGFGSARVAASLLYGVAPVDARTALTTGALLTVASALAVMAPAWNQIRTDPARLLKVT